MPDISNEDLMKLIYRVLKKVDQIEEKLNVLLEGKYKNSKLDEVEYRDIDYEFNNFPIANDEDLQKVSTKIEKDENYKRNLRSFVQRNENVKLEHLFTVEFLFICNQIGSNGRKRLESLVPYDQIYVYLKLQNGETYEEIKKSALEELGRIKNRMYQRKSVEKRRKQKVMETETDETMIMEMLEEDSLDIKEAFETVEEFIDITEVEDDMTTKTEPEETDNEHDMQDQTTDDDDDEANVHFSPIKNNQDLRRITHKINTNPHYLKNLRLQIVEESPNGFCTLQQLFSSEFLQKCKVFGTHDHKNLTDLVPYKEVYFYLRKHLGFSSKEIELEAAKELKTVKTRLTNRVYREKIVQKKKSSSKLWKK